MRKNVGVVVACMLALAISVAWSVMSSAYDQWDNRMWDAAQSIGQGEIETAWHTLEGNSWKVPDFEHLSKEEQDRIMGKAH